MKSSQQPSSTVPQTTLAVALVIVLIFGVELLGQIAAAIARPAAQPDHANQLSAGSSTPSRKPWAASVHYRDGDRWVTVTRLGTAANTDHEIPLTKVQVRAGGLSARALVGKEVLLELDKHTDPELFSRQLHPATLQRISTQRPLFRLTARNHNDALALVESLSQVPGIKSLTPDYHFPVVPQQSAASNPSGHAATSQAETGFDDPRRGAQWYVDALDMDTLWRHVQGDQQTTIVVIDNGCDLDHPDLKAALLPGLDLVDGDDVPQHTPGVPGNNHGTACAGVAAARGDNSIGIAGLCPQCSLRCVRLYDAADRETETDGPSAHWVPVSATVAAFEFAIAQQAAVVSNSWGYAEAVPVPAVLRDVVQDLAAGSEERRGAVVVFAAGNENRDLEADEVLGVEGVIAVNAVNRFDEAAPFGNAGPPMDLSAPTGSFTTDIVGADGDASGDYTSLFGGTSAACPVVAGVAGLLMSAAPNLRAPEIAQALLSSARPAPFAQPDARGHDATYGFGIIDPLAALSEVRPDLAADLLPLSPAAAPSGMQPSATPDADKSDAKAPSDAPQAGSTAAKPDESGPAADAGAENTKGPADSASKTDREAAQTDNGCAISATGHTGSAPLHLLTTCLLALRHRRRRRRSAR